MLKGSLRYYGQSRKIAILMTRLISRMLITCPFDPDAVSLTMRLLSDFPRREYIYIYIYNKSWLLHLHIISEERIHSNYTYIAAVIIFILSV